MNLKRIISALICASIVSTSCFAFTPFAPEASAPGNEQEAVEENISDAQQKPGSLPMRPKDYEYRMFMQILETYVNNHLYEFTEEEVLYQFIYDFLEENPMYLELFINYMLGTMDPYSSYHEASSGFLNPDEEGKGFGFMIKDSGEGVYIETVIKGSNAEDAGFMPGDKFSSVAGINVEGQAYDIVAAILASPNDFIGTTGEATEENAESKNPEVEIVVDRNGEKIALKLHRGPMALSQISTYIDDNGGKPTAYIDVASFLGSETDKEFIELIRKYEKDGIKHLTIDLRDNGGGSLDYALSMAEIFLEKDELICYYNDRTLEKPKPIYSTNEKSKFDSIVILINEYSASAAELFTSILSDKGIAKTVGKKSYGKSLGQSVYTLPNGDYITITTYQMLNEKLESYDGIGLKPDISIEDIEMCFELPSLLSFNHKNAKEIKEGVYSDVTKALEDRLVIMGLLREKYADGIFDDVTKTALYVFQTNHKIENADGYVNDKTVSSITRIINGYKSGTYYDDTQYDVAMIIHHSFSQGKRLAVEKERLREKESKKILERDEKLNAEADAKAS